MLISYYICTIILILQITAHHLCELHGHRKMFLVEGAEYLNVRIARAKIFDQPTCCSNHAHFCVNEDLDRQTRLFLL